MPSDISDLHDYSVVAWVMDKPSWRFVFDSCDGATTVQHELIGVLKWHISSLRDGVTVNHARLMEVEGAVSLDRSDRQFLSRSLGMSADVSDEDYVRVLEELKGAAIYTIDTVCGETVDIICAEVREQFITQRSSR